MPGGRPSPQQMIAARKAAAAKAAAQKKADANFTKTSTQQQKAAGKNGVTTGSVVSNLTGGHVKTDPQSGKTVTTMTAEQVKQMQRFLINQGFKIGASPDGRYGPLTKTAAEAWRNSAPGTRKAAVDKWNAAHTMGSPTNYNPQTGNPNKGPKNTYTDTTGSSTGKTKPPTADPTASMLQALIGSMTKEVGNYDPNALAISATNEQYEPQINEALRQLNLDRSAKSNDQSDIENWFSGLVSQNKQQGTDMKDALNNTVSDSDPLLANIMGSLTDQGAKYNVGKTALNNQGLLKAIGLSDQDFSSNMNTALALRGRDEANAQGKSDQTNIDSASQTLLGLIGQKANALTTNQSQYAQQGLANQTNLFNLLSQYSLLPAQAQAASLKSQYTAAQIMHLMSPTAKSPKYNTNSLLQQVSGLLNVGQDRKLPQGKTLQQAAQTIGSVLQGVPNLTPGSAQYRNLGYQILGSMLNQNGQPIQAPAGWFTGK